MISFALLSRNPRYAQCLLTLWRAAKSAPYVADVNRDSGTLLVDGEDRPDAAVM
jgi:hypothetical protein